MADRWVKRPEKSNWGDFGQDDQIGRMNLVTPERRLRAIRTVEQGRIFSLSLPLDYPGGSVLATRRRPPRLFYGTRDGSYEFNYALQQGCACHIDVVSDDAVVLYTQYSTQWDALSHVGQMFDIDDNGREERVYYNGYRAGIHVRDPAADGGGDGAVALGIDKLAAVGVQGRGVMVDLQRAVGSERVAVGYEQLMEIMSAQNVSVEEGDFLCLHTGFTELVLGMNRSPDGEILARSCAVLDGRDDRLLDWVSQSGIAAICADNFAVERYPNPPAPKDRFSILPLHNHCLFRIGVHLGELWYFTELQKWLREHDRTTFLLTAPPLRLPGAVGSPVTPIATV